jgi:hypothetical protein
VKLSERSEFASFPILRLAQLGIPQGQRLCGAFFGNLTTTTEEHQAQNNSKQKHHQASAHIPCGLQANMPANPHGICVSGHATKNFRGYLLLFSPL